MCEPGESLSPLEAQVLQGVPEQVLWWDVIVNIRILITISGFHLHDDQRIKTLQTTCCFP